MIIVEKLKTMKSYIIGLVTVEQQVYNTTFLF